MYPWLNFESLRFVVPDAPNLIAIYPHLVGPHCVSIMMYAVDG
ncbi:uncharacterized protein METZ01_LOCUS2154 [marine metagenome]|uniref:Uncharacterized protein n=1 Tax=marine metagenome TaxID=408172 RepID=A0A381N3V0_9ZZZZ